MTHASKHGHGERHHRKRARALLHKAGYRNGGHLHGATKLIGEAVHEHEANMHKGKKPTHLKLKRGGIAEGFGPKRHAGRKHRTGSGKGHTVVVVNNGHGGGGGEPRPVPVPVPKPVPVPVAAGPGGPGGPGGMPPGGPTPDMAAGAPPPMKRGGRAHFKKGGKTKGYPLDDGSDSGEGRLEKARAYGARTK